MLSKMGMTTEWHEERMKKPAEAGFLKSAAIT